MNTSPPRNGLGPVGPDNVAPDRPGWRSVSEAAAALGLSPDALRKRLERGQLAGEKRDGRWLVAPLSHAPGQTPLTGPSVRTRPDPSSMGTGRSGRSSSEHAARLLAAKDAALERADAEIAYLRDALDARSRELANERERADVLMQVALARIPALTTGGDAPQTRQEGPGTTGTPNVKDEPDQPPAVAPKPSFWARLFGR